MAGGGRDVDFSPSVNTRLIQIIPLIIPCQPQVLLFVRDGEPRPFFGADARADKPLGDGEGESPGGRMEWKTIPGMEAIASVAEKYRGRQDVARLALLTLPFPIGRSVCFYLYPICISYILSTLFQQYPHSTPFLFSSDYFIARLVFIAVPLSTAWNVWQYFGLSIEADDLRSPAPPPWSWTDGNSDAGEGGATNTDAIGKGTTIQVTRCFRILFSVII